MELPPVIIRDYAYKEDEAMFHGIYDSTQDIQPKAISEEESDFSEASDNTEQDWYWRWSKSDNEDIKKLESVLNKIIANIGSSLTDFEDLNVHIVKTTTSYHSQSEYEMSMKAGEEFLAFQYKKVSKDDDRWASIGGLNIDQILLYEPSVGEIADAVSQFLESNKKYGAGWITALKIKISCKSDTVQVSLVFIFITAERFRSYPGQLYQRRKKLQINTIVLSSLIFCVLFLVQNLISSLF